MKLSRVDVPSVCPSLSYLMQVILVHAVKTDINSTHSQKGFDSPNWLVVALSGN